MMQALLSRRVPLAPPPPLVFAAPVAQRRTVQQLSNVAFPLEGTTMLSCETMYYEFAQHWTHTLTLQAQEARIPARYAYYSDSSLAQKKSDGMKRLDLVMRTFDEVCKTRSPWQQKLHMQMLRANLFQVLGKDYDVLVERVCQEYGWAGPKQEVMAIASRRSGKTYGTAMYAATILLCVPNIEVVVFSLSKRQSQKMLLLISQFVLKTEKGRKMLKGLSVEKMILRGDESSTDSRVCQSFPGRSDVSKLCESVAGPGRGVKMSRMRRVSFASRKLRSRKGKFLHGECGAPQCPLPIRVSTAPLSDVRFRPQRYAAAVTACATARLSTSAPIGRVTRRRVARRV